MSKFDKIFEVKCPVIGMIHIPALPGTPQNNLSHREIIDKALHEAGVYRKAGIDGLMIENMHDVPYTKNEVGPEINGLMSIIGHEIKRNYPLPCGIQILSSANKAALATAHAANLDFVRVEGFVFGHVADEGYIDATAGELLRYRKLIGAEHISIWTDVKKKHSAHAITSDISLAEMGKASEFFLSDGIIVTGRHTASPIDREDITNLRQATMLPVIAGSGVTFDNVEEYVRLCDALIVGSHFKKKGHWANDLNPQSIESFIKKMVVMRKVDSGVIE